MTKKEKTVRYVRGNFPVLRRKGLRLSFAQWLGDSGLLFECPVFIEEIGRDEEKQSTLPFDDGTETIKEEVI